MEHSFKKIFFTASALIAASSSAYAETSEWQTTLGLGAMVRPTYEGSDSYTVTPIPYINSTYNDMLQIGPDSVSVYTRQDNLKLGIGGIYHGGREDSDDGGIFSNGDDYLQGMGDIDSAFGAKAYTSYSLGSIALDAAATKYFGDDNDGILLEAGISSPYKVSEQLSLTPNASVTWANEDYMQTWFGVSPAQSAASGFSAYNAGAGIKNVDVGVRADYAFDANWFISGNAKVKFLTGDAADSPITESDINGTLLTMVGYRF